MNGLKIISYFSLTNEKEVVLKTAEAGHNVFITSQAGTGKSFLVISIVKTLRSCGRKVVVICTSGISCSVYGDLNSRNVHSLYALGTADMPSQMVITRAASMPHRMQEIFAADTIIWEKAGMSSQGILEIVNAIHDVVVQRENRWKPFGCKQLQLVEDLLQLRPVPNLFDDGNFMFQSPVFEKAITHRFELTRLMRQDSADPCFNKALGELQVGDCSDERARFLESLSQPVAGSPVQLPGDLFTFDCNDEGNRAGIS